VSWTVSLNQAQCRSGFCSEGKGAGLIRAADQTDKTAAKSVTDGVFLIDSLAVFKTDMG